MQIDRAQSGLPVASSTVADRRETGARDFRAALQAAVETAASAPAPPRVVAAALGLRMLQQAVVLGDGDADAEGFPALPPLPALPSIYRQFASQNFGTPAGIGSAPGPPPPAAAAVYDRQNDLCVTPALSRIIDRAASRYAVAPELIRAVIRAESGFDAQAVSPVGATGLMQLMPATARELGVNDPFDPEQNVMAGTRYLKTMLQRYHGDLGKALAAYNWGPGNLDRGRERLPTETRDYIAKIRAFLAADG